MDRPQPHQRLFDAVSARRVVSALGQVDAVRETLDTITEQVTRLGRQVEEAAANRDAIEGVVVEPPVTAEAHVMTDVRPVPVTRSGTSPARRHTNRALLTYGATLLVGAAVGVLLARRR